MTASLSDLLAADSTKQQITNDCLALIQQELDAKSGVSAAALKLAHKAVVAFAPGYYQATVEKLIPRFLMQLQPFWSEFQAAGGGQFGDYLAGRSGEVAESLLSVTDAMARGSDRAAVVRLYNGVRDGAGKHIEAALPAVGALVQRYGG